MEEEGEGEGEEEVCEVCFCWPIYMGLFIWISALTR